MYCSWVLPITSSYEVQNCTVPGVQKSVVQYSAVQCTVVQDNAVQYSAICAIQCISVQCSSVECSAIWGDCSSGSPACDCTNRLHVQDLLHSTACTTHHCHCGYSCNSLFTQMASRPVNLIGRKIRLSLSLSVPHILKVTRSTRSNNTFNHSFQDNTISDFFYEPPGLCVSFYPFK